MSLKTIIFDLEKARIAALAEQANRNVQFQPAIEGYDEPYLTVAGVQVFVSADNAGVVRVSIVTVDSADEPLVEALGGLPLVVEIDHEYRVYSSAHAAEVDAAADDKRPYTVIGVVDAGERIVAGVLPGEHSTIDADGSPRGDCRFTEFVWASSPAEAEELARKGAVNGD